MLSQVEQLGRGAGGGGGLLPERAPGRAHHQAVGDHVQAAQVCYIARKGASECVTLAVHAHRNTHDKEKKKERAWRRSEWQPLSAQCQLGVETYVQLC